MVSFLIFYNHFSSFFLFHRPIFSIWVEITSTLLCHYISVSGPEIEPVALCVHAKLLQLCWTHCDPMDCSLPGSSVHRILQARILEWVAIALLQGIFLTQGLNPHRLHLISYIGSCSIKLFSE